MEGKKFSHLANGHARTAAARIRMRHAWNEIAKVLNSDGTGCVKDWKQWAKYWKDKKAGIKRKANVAEAAKKKTGCVDDEDYELSEVDKRILSIAGGLSIANGDRHLAIKTFPKQERKSHDKDNAGLSDGQNHSNVFTVKEDGTIQWENSTSAYIRNGSMKEHESSSSATSAPCEVMVRVSEDEWTKEERSVSGSPKGKSSPTPSWRGGSPHRPSHGSTKRRHNFPASPRATSGREDSTATRRLLKRFPPSLPRSELARLTERLIAIEERRVEADNTTARSLEIFAQGQLKMAEAIQTFTDTLNNVAQQIIVALKPRNPTF